jgi:hypothetical protein
MISDDTARSGSIASVRYVSHGMVPEVGDVQRLTGMLGRPLHSCREFVTALAGKAWARVTRHPVNAAASDGETGCRCVAGSS